ncbi:MAG: nucleotidyl transferase AbiEii/AbiGii toxin family protein [Thermoleophilia bacterium]
MTASDIRRRLKEHADELGLEFQQALQYYAMERFLYRLSKTPWSERFVVKGAVMLRVWDAAMERPTRDIDFLGRIDNTPAAVSAIVLECLAIEVDDGIVFSQNVSAEQITVEDRYPGVGVKIRGELSGARFTVRLDIGIDDATVPEPAWVDYPTLLNELVPHILAYQPPTAVAEKFEAMVNLGLVNSRLKDFYDIWMLSQTLNFDGQELAAALSATFSKRGTALPAVAPVALTDEFTRQSATTTMWSTYRRTLAASNIEVPERLEEVVSVITRFIMPAAAAAATGEPLEKSWLPDSGWQ